MEKREEEEEEERWIVVSTLGCHAMQPGHAAAGKKEVARTPASQRRRRLLFTKPG